MDAGAPPGRAGSGRVRPLLTTLVAAARADDRRTDALTAAATFVLGWLTLQVGLVGLFAHSPDAPGTGWRVALLAVGCLLILVKRKHPVRALLGGVALVGLDLSWGGSLAMVLVLWDMLFAAAMWAGSTARRWLWGTTSAAVAAGTVAATASAGGDLRTGVFAVLQLGALLLIPLWWATNVRQKSELVVLEAARADLASERARLAERQAALERRRAEDAVHIAELDRHEAVRAERAAMARDLHDVVASHLSAIAIHSGAALAAPTDTDRDRAALGLVRSSAITSLEEMRSMILLLRTEAQRGEAGTDGRNNDGRDNGRDNGRDDGRGAPAETLAAPARLAAGGLERLVDATRAGGTAVVVDDPDGVAGSLLPAAVDQALHRIAQEALTNAVKHAPREPVALRLRQRGGEVELAVENAGAAARSPKDPAAGPWEPALSGGSGLLTMRERAAGLGGSLSAGPTQDGGWSVLARVPLRVADAERQGS